MRKVWAKQWCHLKHEFRDCTLPFPKAKDLLVLDFRTKVIYLGKTKQKLLSVLVRSAVVVQGWSYKYCRIDSKCRVPQSDDHTKYPNLYSISFHTDGVGWTSLCSKIDRKMAMMALITITMKLMTGLILMSFVTSGLSLILSGFLTKPHVVWNQRAILSSLATVESTSFRRTRLCW